MNIRIIERDGSVAFYRGPLLYAADVKHNETTYPATDFSSRKPLSKEHTHSKAYDAIFEPVSEWRFAVDPSTVKVIESNENATLPNPIWVNDGPPTSLEIIAYPIHWPVENGTAAKPPVDPVVDPRKNTTIKLVPFGAAKLHIAQFPIARLDG